MQQMHSTYDLPPIEGIMALLAAADEGSFSGAAAKLDLTHGSISRRIASLEHWLGTPLFERHGRGVRLTPAGLRFDREARQSLSALSHSAEQWRPRRGRQTIRLSVVPSFARLWLLQRLTAIEGADIHVDLSLEHRSLDLDAREADIAIRYGRGGWPGVDATRIMSEALTPVASPELRARLGASPAAEELLRLPLLHDSDTSQWRAFLRQQGIEYRPRWQDRRFEDYDTVLAAAEAGLGLALLRRPLADDRLASGRLMRLGDRELANPAGHFVCLRDGETRRAVLIARERLHLAAAQQAGE